AKRIKTLVVPYIFWNALVWMIKILPTVIEDPSSLNIFQIFKDFLYYGNGTMPIAFQFWFIRDLMYMIILSPILYLLLRKGKLITLLLLFAIWFFPVIHTKYLPSLAALFFFSFGAFYGINGRNIIKDLAYLPNIPLLLLTITSAIIDLIINEPPTTIVHGAINNVYIHKIFILSGIITLLNFISSMLYNKNINKKLSSASFFLFASHPLILSKIIKSAVNILPHNDFSFLTIYLLSVPLTVIICIGIYNLLKRFLPTFTSVITGGR
ncbi:MAG: acyltransferase family protein, partial [Bacteroidales bacterium]|nr:acyltransferase family protein [Bacteroidales bacterium]